MGKRLLELAGYEHYSGEDLTPSVEDAIGAAGLLYVMNNRGRLPDDPNELQSIVDSANFILTDAGQEPTATVEAVSHELAFGKDQ